MIRKVPKEFVLGAAMSAYQMEGAAAAGGREPHHPQRDGHARHEHL